VNYLEQGIRDLPEESTRPLPKWVLMATIKRLLEVDSGVHAISLMARSYEGMSLRTAKEYVEYLEEFPIVLENFARPQAFRRF